MHTKCTHARVWFFGLFDATIMSHFLVQKISECERIFITHGIDLNIRSDGRTCDDFRMIFIEQNIIETCNGSAHVRSGNTDVIVGIKLELEETNNDNNDGDIVDQGRVQVTANISAIASQAFDGKLGDSMTEQIEAIFGQFLPNCLDLKQLIIVPGKSYFVLHVDVVILEFSSLATLIDITSIAIKTSLYDLRIPKVNVSSAEQKEFTVSEDEFQSVTLDVSQVPLVTTYTKVGSKFIVDSTWEEEQASIGTISVAFLPPNKIAMIKKIRPGSINIDTLPSFYQFAIKFGSELSTKFEEKIQQKNVKKAGRISFLLN